MANNNIAAIPELWSREGLRILVEQSVTARSVNRQYSDDIRNYGETVHCHRAARRKTRRKTDNDQFVAADAELASVPVVLNQWFYDSFIIKDGEMSKSLVDLRAIHLVPAIQTISRGIDRAVLGCFASKCNRFGSPTLRAGKLLGMTKSNSADTILEAQEIMHTNNAPDGPHQAIVHQTTQTYLQGNELFASADKRGSSTTLTTGKVGQIYNTLVDMSQNVPYAYEADCETEKGTVLTGTPQAAGYAGSIALTDDFSRTLAVGEFFVLKENGQPTWITATDGDDAVTLNEPLKYAVTALSEVVSYAAVTNESVERTAGYDGLMRFTHGSGKNLKAGRLLAFGTTSRHTYVIIEATVVDATHTDVLLDRPLDATVASGASAYPGPAGAINPLLHQDAVALVSRPLALPGDGFGVMSRVQSYEGMGLRVSMQYDSKEGGMRVNVDMLAGIAVLDEALCCMMLS